ncbi:MAG: glycosyltransferase [Planctomycetota bacterium]
MTSENKPDRYREGLRLAETGRYQEAFEHISKHLRECPDDAEALNDIGAILHCLGRTDEAIAYFNKARSILGDSGEVIWNLSEAYIAVGKARETAGLFESMERIGILNPDILNRTAEVFLNQNDKANALEMLLWSLKIAPNQVVLAPMIEVIRGKRPKVAFFCGGDGMTFLYDIIEFIEKRFEVRVFEGQTAEEMYELMQWSDISWFEWCTNLAVAASNKPKVCRNIVRLHRYEAYEHWPRQVNWGNIDVLVTVGNAVTLETLKGHVPELESRTSVVTVPNGINLQKFPFVDRRRGKNIAFLGNLRMVKNPMLVLQCMQKLTYIDSEYRLFLGVTYQDQVLEQYLRHMVDTLGLGGNILFDGWQSDVNAWLGDKHYIVSTSVCEGHPVGILEGMSCGLKPVIHNFLGAEQIFPAEFLFNIAEQFCDQITGGAYDPQRYRQFVEQRYSQRLQLSRINGIFTSLEAQIESESIVLASAAGGFPGAGPASSATTIGRAGDPGGRIV